MDLWTMVVLIVFVCVGGGLISEYMKTQRVKAKTGANPEGQGELEAELAQLRARVETLEKIVTDERFDLGREIDRLERTG